MHTYCTGSAAFVADLFDRTYRMIHVLPLAFANLGERVPLLGFQSHAGATASRNDIAIDEATACYDCPL